MYKTHAKRREYNYKKKQKTFQDQAALSCLKNKTPLVFSLKSPDSRK